MPSDKQYRERKAAGLCGLCGAAPTEPEKASCVSCLEKQRRRQNKSYRRENGERARKRKENRKRSVARIEELNRQGWSDREIARRMGCSSNRVRTLRVRLGLPSNAHNERHNKKAWASRLRQLKRDGASNLAEFIGLSRRIRAATRGWPTDLGPGELGILELLDAAGPKSKNEIMSLMGLRYLRSGGGGGVSRSYLRNLIQAAIVEVRREPSPYGPPRRLYAISPDFKAARAARQRSNGGLLSVPIEEMA